MSGGHEGSLIRGERDLEISFRELSPCLMLSPFSMGGSISGAPFLNTNVCLSVCLSNGGKEKEEVEKVGNQLPLGLTNWFSVEKMRMSN